MIVSDDCDAAGGFKFTRDFLLVKRHGVGLPTEALDWVRLAQAFEQPHSRSDRRSRVVYKRSGVAWAHSLVQRQWKGDEFHRLHEKLIEPETQEALRIIFAAKPEEFSVPQGQRLEDMCLRLAAEEVLNLYDLVGKRVEADTIPLEAVVDSEWPNILHVAQQLGSFIDHEESERGTAYKSGFRWLVARIRDNGAIVEDLARRNPGSRQHPWTRLPTVPVVGLTGFRNSRPAVAVFIVSQNEFLLFDRANPPLGWETPGGLLDDGEHPQACVAREVFEETGLTATSRLDLANMQLHGVHSGNYGGKYTPWTCATACSLILARGPRSSMIRGETKATDWYPVGKGRVALEGDRPRAFFWIANENEKLMFNRPRNPESH